MLDDVSFDLREGEVHVLAGENGAGKSTLIKILAGIHTEYEGAMELEGKPVHFSTPQEARQCGISVIHQEMSLVDSMSVLDNIYLGREPSRFGGCWLDRTTQVEQSGKFCEMLDLSCDELDRPVEGFSFPVKNRIEIAKALTSDARVLVMDEPTSALDRPEVDKLFALIETLKKAGCCIVYISHKMEEIYRIADRITVLRDGRWVGTAEAKDCPEQRLIQWMICREISEQFPEPLRVPGAAARLELRNFIVPARNPSQRPTAGGVSLRVHAGEIVGIAGLQGSGASELFQGLFGCFDKDCPGTVEIDGIAFRPRNPTHAIQRGLAYLTADRKSTGLVLPMSVEKNVSLSSLPWVSLGGWLRPRKERANARKHVDSLHIRLASLDQAVGTLSGGNQQKVVLAKWLETKPGVLLLEDPTRGVDIGSKREIYSLMRQWTAERMAILLISSELPELLGLSDRIIVLHRGSVAAQFSKEDATQENVLAAAMGSVAPGKEAA